MSRKEKLLVTCNLPLPCPLRARVWSFVSSSSSWWPNIVLPDDVEDCSIEARDGDRVLICGRQHVDTHLLKVGVVAREKLEISPEAVYVCRKRVTLRGQTGAEVTFSEDVSGYSQCLVLAGDGGAVENLRVLGKLRCPLELISGNWQISKCIIRAPPTPTWDAFTASGGSIVFQRCRLIGAHSVISLYPVSFSGATTQGSTPTHVILDRCVIQDGCFSGITVGEDTSLVAKRCVFLRNGRGASQPHIELFALLTFALPRRIKSQIADFIAPGMAAQLHSPVSTTDQNRQNLGCVLQLCSRATAEVTKCQFGANGVVAHTQLKGPWYRLRADAPHILASENVTADGRQVQIACTLDAHRRDTLAQLEADRDRKGMGLAPWGVSPEEEQEILRREVERNQPPWLEE